MAKTQTETFIRRSVVDALRRAGWFVIYNMQMGFGQHRGLAARIRCSFKKIVKLTA